MHHFTSFVNIYRLTQIQIQQCLHLLQSINEQKMDGFDIMFYSLALRELAHEGDKL